MVTIYNIDPKQRRITQLRANLAQRTVEALTQGPELPSMPEFARHTAAPRQKARNPYQSQNPASASGLMGGNERRSIVTASKLMSAPMILASPGTHPEIARKLMLQHQIHHLPIIAEGVITGLLCEHDLLTRATGQETLEPMLSDYLVVNADTPVSVVALVMLSRGQSACLVRNDQGLAGILTEHDLIKSLLPPREQLSA